MKFVFLKTAYQMLLLKSTL